MNLLKSIGNMFSFGGTKPSQYRNDQMQQARNVAGLTDFYRNLQAQGLARQKQFLPQYDTMVQRRLGQLNNPMSDGDAARFMGQGYSAANTAYDAANARLQNNLAARGIDGGIAAGAMANLEGNRARAMGQTQNEIAMRKMALRDQYAREALGLLGGQFGQAQQMATAGTAGLAGNYNNLYSLYGNVAQQDEQRRAQNRAGLMNLLGQAGQVAGYMYGGPMGAAAAKGLTRQPPIDDYNYEGLSMPTPYGGARY